jgi:hypothetical protein
MRRWCSTVVHSIMCGFEKVTSSILHQDNWTPRTDRKRSVWRDCLCARFLKLRYRNTRRIVFVSLRTVLKRSS